MKTWLSTCLARIPSPGAGPARTPAPALPAGMALPETRACGWFESSLDLQQGLAVSDLADPDWTVLALWFGQPSARRPLARP